MISEEEIQNIAVGCAGSKGDTSMAYGVYLLHRELYGEVKPKQYFLANPETENNEATIGSSSRRSTF